MGFFTKNKKDKPVVINENKQEYTVKDVLSHIRNLKARASGETTANTVYARIVASNGVCFEHYIRDRKHKNTLEGFEYAGKGKEWLLDLPVERVKLTMDEPLGGYSVGDNGDVYGARFYDVYVLEECLVPMFSKNGKEHFQYNEKEYSDCLTAIREFKDERYRLEAIDGSEGAAEVLEGFTYSGYDPSSDEFFLNTEANNLHELFFVSSNTAPDGSPSQILPLPEWFWKNCPQITLPMDMTDDDSDCVFEEFKHYEDVPPSYSRSYTPFSKRSVFTTRSYCVVPPSDENIPGYKGHFADGTECFCRDGISPSRFNEVYFDLLDKAYAELEADPRRRCPTENYEVMSKFDILEKYRTGEIIFTNPTDYLDIFKGLKLEKTLRHASVGGMQAINTNK